MYTFLHHHERCSRYRVCAHFPISIKCVHITVCGYSFQDGISFLEAICVCKVSVVIHIPVKVYKYWEIFYSILLSISFFFLLLLGLSLYTGKIRNENDLTFVLFRFIYRRNSGVC